MLYILAGNYPEAKYWAISKKLSLGQDAKYVSSSRVLRGSKRYFRYVQVGMWKDHACFYSIQRMIMLRNGIRINKELDAEYFHNLSKPFRSLFWKKVRVRVVRCL